MKVLLILLLLTFIGPARAHPGHEELHGFANEDEVLSYIYGTAEGRPVEYVQDRATFEVEGATNVSQKIMSTTLLTAEKVWSAFWVIDVAMTLELEEASVGTHNVTLMVDGAPFDACYAHAHTTNKGPGVQKSAYYDLRCINDAPSFGVHDVSVNFTVIDGTPGDVADASIAIGVRRLEFVTDTQATTLNVTSAVDDYVPFLIWGSLVIFFAVRGGIFAAACALVVNAAFLFDPPLMGIAGGVMLVLIGIATQAIANGILPRRRAEP